MLGIISPLDLVAPQIAGTLDAEGKLCHISFPFSCAPKARFVCSIPLGLRVSYFVLLMLENMPIKVRMPLHFDYRI